MTAALVITSLIFIALLLAWRWRPQGPVELGVRMLLLAYGLMGAWTLWFHLFAPGGEPAGFDFLKPTVLFWSLAFTLIIAPLRGWGYPAKALFGTFFVLSPRVWLGINWGTALACVVFGGANLFVISSSVGNFEAFKYSCRVLLMFIILLRLNFVWLDLVSRVGIQLYRRVRAFFP